MSKVVVIVLNWCGEDVSRACLESLRESRYEAADVLLVDNGSDDGSGERLRVAFPEVSYLQTGSNLGYAGGNNRGIEWALQAGADHILVLNNDTEVDAECVGRLVAALRSHPGAGAAAPRVLYHSDPTRAWYDGGSFSSLRGLGVHREGPEEASPVTGVEEVTFVTGCCVLLDAEALRVVGDFDEEFFAYVEDADLSVRLTAAGYKLLYEPQARVLHRCAPLGAAPSPFQIRQRDRNRRRLMKKHFGIRKRLPFALWFLTTRMILYLRYRAAGDTDRAAAIIEGATGAGFVAPKPAPERASTG